MAVMGVELSSLPYKRRLHNYDSAVHVMSMRFCIFMAIENPLTI